MNTKDFSQLKAKVVKDLKEVSRLDGVISMRFVARHRF
jgi:hypothetical protein